MPTPRQTAAAAIEEALSWLAEAAEALKGDPQARKAVSEAVGDAKLAAEAIAELIEEEDAEEEASRAEDEHEMLLIESPAYAVRVRREERDEERHDDWAGA